MGAKTDFIEYVISDSSAAYPDGGVKDGYWYEKIKELTPEMFGFKKIDVSSFILPSSSKSVSFNTSGIGKKPQLILVLAKDNSDETHVGRVALLASGASPTYAYGAFTVIHQGGNLESTTSGITCTMAVSSVGISVSNYNFAAGVEYAVILMA